MSCCTACHHGTASACSSPSPSPKRKSPSPQAARNVLPKEVWQAIAQTLNARSRASLARAIPGVVTRNRRVLVRSLATAKPLKVPVVLRTVPKKQALLNIINPVAYKNTQWRYYKPYTYQYGHYPAYRAFFYNTANGEPFIINNKTGRRKPVPARVVVEGNLPMNEIARGRRNLRPRKTIHTWNAYMKRAGAAQRYVAGESKRNQKFNTIHRNVTRYLRGNRTALNRYPLSDLMYWAKEINWSTPNSSLRFPYLRKRGMWFRGGNRVTKESFMNQLLERFGYINN